MTKKFISAGAGSGKTYTITNQVADMIKDGKLKAEQVIMTTFTKAAAQELREKAKKELNDRKLYQEAQQMEHALIGTVHSVANTFLTKYWYLLGIMPDAAAMEEDEVQAFRDHSLRGLLKPEERRFLYKYAEDYNVGFTSSVPKPGINYGFWKDDLNHVLDYILWYDIDNEQLNKSLQTTESIIKCLGPQEDKDIQKHAQACIQEITKVIDNMKKHTPKARDQKDVINRFRNKVLTIPELNELAEIAKDRCKESKSTLKLTASLIAPTIFTADSVDDHKQYAKIIFRLASEWQNVYRQYKDEHHLIDFNDMEEMFFKLLNMDEVQQDIRSRYTHLFVDEFQDSNPIQVKIFQKLSELLNTTYVGDKKQAIYGFRGSDTELTAAVADSIHDKEPLPHSYRTIEPLVNFSNKIFTQVFKNMSDVELSIPEKNGNYDQVKKPAHP